MKQRPSILSLLFLISLPILLGACAPTMVNVSQAPDYYPTAEPIAIDIGVIASEHHTVTTGKSRIVHAYAPQIVDRLRHMRVFRNIIYPYHSGADAVLNVTMDGNWQYHNRGRAIANLLIGTPNYEDVEGITKVNVKLVVPERTPEPIDRVVIGKTITIDTTGQYTGTDTDEIARMLNEVQIKKISGALANLMEDNRAKIIGTTARNEETTTNGNATTTVNKNNASIDNRNKPVAQKEELVPQKSVAADNNKNTNLVKIEELHKEGILSDAEYNNAKNKLSPAQPEKATTEDKLSELNELHKSGVLSNADFEKARQRLDELNKLDELHGSKILSDEDYKKAKERLLAR
jgi:Short C-terminal domain